MLALGCRDKEAPQPPPQPERVATSDAAAPAAPKAVVLGIAGDKLELARGIATYRPGGVEIRLATRALPCAEIDAYDKSATEVAFIVPPGPEGKHYVQRPIGIPINVQHGGVPIVLAPDETTLTLEDFPPLMAGAHVKGKLEATTPVVALAGSFDVEICKEPSTPVRALRATAPITPAAGRFDTSKLEPKTAHAIVLKRGARPYLARIVFYDKADVPCPKTETDNAADVLFTVTGFGMRRTPTPADGLLVQKNPAAQITFDAWIAIETATIEAGDHVKGSVWAQPTFAWEGKGDFGGTFDAAVCML